VKSREVKRAEVWREQRNEESKDMERMEMGIDWRCEEGYYGRKKYLKMGRKAVIISTN